MSFEQLPTPPGLERLSMVAFSAPADDMLLVGSYDKSVLLYEHTRKSLVAEWTAPAPVLAVGHTRYNATFAGLLDGTIRHVDYENMKLSSPMPGLTPSSSISRGIHTVRSVDNTLVAATYGGAILQLDPRSSSAPNSLDTTGKIFAMDVSSEYITVGKSGQQVEIYDVRKLQTPVSVRSTGLRYQVTALRTFPSEEGYALSSVDGRVSVEYFDDSAETQARKYAFKCHRVRDSGGVDSVYPVTSMRFHPKFHTLLTAGGDGNVCVWNWEKRKRMKLLSCSVPLAHMDIDSSGGYLAVGGGDDSYGRSKDVDAVGPGTGKVFVRSLSEADCKPRS